MLDRQPRQIPQLIPAILRQIREPGWSVERPIPRDYPAHAVPAE